MLDFLDKYSESSYAYKDKKCWPIILKTSKNFIFNTLKELLPDYGFNDITINNDFGECYFEQDGCEITLTLINNESNIQINTSIYCTKIGKTFKKLKQVSNLLNEIFNGFIVER